MITKLTAQNAELYYAPRFAEITKAFAEIGSPIVIKSLEDYFLHLTDIANLQVGAKNIKNAYLLVAPADEDIFTINANTREILVPTFVKRNGIGVYGDHRAEMIVMTIDRYFDHEDFLQDKIAINWKFIPSGMRNTEDIVPQAVEAFAPNEELNPGLITFGFIITKDMTPKSGTLTFSVTIYDERSGEIVYSFNTTPVSVTVKDSLTLSNPTEVKSDIDNYVGRLTNSVYIDETIASIGDPVWETGEIINSTTGEKSGLAQIAYLDSSEDQNNVYPENGGVLLQARATVDPNSAELNYKWTFQPVDGTVNTGREFVTVNLQSDYIKVDSLPREDDGTIYYEKDEMGRINPPETNVYTWEQAIEALEEDENLELWIRGTSYRAHSAGNYQVHAQARIGVGNEEYVQVLENAQLKVGVKYYKKVGNEIDNLHPLINEEALAAQQEGEVLYIRPNASRNSNEIASNVLVIPAAKQPHVELSVDDSNIVFGGDLIKLEETADETQYTYIDSGIIPTITATISLDNATSEDYAGAFAYELIHGEVQELSVDDIENNNNLVFQALPNTDSRVLTFQPATIQEGTYTVRVINRRNHTYSVSDPSDSIITSFVAPAADKITVTADMGEDAEPKVMLSEGRQPNDTLQVVTYGNGVNSYTFTITDSSGNYPEASVAYIVEEVDENGEPLEVDEYPAPIGNREIYDVITDDNSITFTITRDPGYFRIKTINTYHNTQRTCYSQVFRILGS